MQNLATELGLKDEVVRFTGLKQGDDLTKAYEEADFTVLSSRYETFGTVIVESLASGTPVVSTRVGVAPEVINDQNGVLIPPEDTNALAEAIIRMLNSGNTYNREAIRNEIINRFTPEVISDKLLSIYSQIRKDV
jgi:glycosyltransferase involved in cell wall biosynthesis